MESDRIISEKDYKWQLRNGWIPDKDYVFVSYSSLDWDKVYPCVMALRAKGINVYIDIEFMENQSSSWLKNFQERLFRDSGCKGIVTFLSINYMRSYACLVEQMANRTNRMRKHAGRFLPVFYVALDPELGTLQQMSTYIYDDEIRRESTSQRVEISPPEYTVLQKFILDSNPEAYRDTEAVQELLDDIHDKHDVVINMYDLIFSNTKDMPNIQVFEGVEKCARILTDNFINDKNNSIKLEILEDLKQETMKKLGKTAPEEPLVKNPYTRAPHSGEPDIQKSAPEKPYTPELHTPESNIQEAHTQKMHAQEAYAQERHSQESRTQEFHSQQSSTQHQKEPASQERTAISAYNKINSIGRRFYAKYGSLVTSQQLCKQCGATLNPGDKFCSKCGAKVE